MKTSTRNIILSILVVLFIILLGIGIGYMGYQLSVKSAEAERLEEEKKEEVISLDETEKENLTEEFMKVNFSYANNYQYFDNNNRGLNIFDSDTERYKLTINYIFNEEVYPKKINKNYVDCESDNECFVKLSYVHYKCMEIFSRDFDETKISEGIFGSKYGEDYATNIVVSNNKIDTPRVKEKRYNKETDVYSLKVEFLSSENTVVREATVKYKIQNDKKILLSWVYTK